MGITRHRAQLAILVFAAILVSLGMVVGVSSAKHTAVSKAEYRSEVIATNTILILAAAFIVHGSLEIGPYGMHCGEKAAPTA